MLLLTEIFNKRVSFPELCEKLYTCKHKIPYKLTNHISTVNMLRAMGSVHGIAHSYKQRSSKGVIELQTWRDNQRSASGCISGRIHG